MEKQDNLLKQSLTSCKKAFLFALLFSFFINFSMLIVPLYSLQVLDRVLSSHSVETLMALFTVVIVVLAFIAVLQIARSFVFGQISIWLEKSLYPALISKTVDNSVKISGIGAQYLRDLGSIKSFISSPSLVSLFDAPWSIIYFIVIFMIHPINGFITVIGAVIILLLAFLNEFIVNRKLKRLNEQNVAFYNKVASLTYNAESITAMGMKQNVIDNLKDLHQNNIELDYHAKSSLYFISAFTKMIRIVIQTLTIAAGAILVIKGEMSAGGIIAVSILAGRALLPFDAAANIWQQLVNVRKSYDRIYQAIDSYTDINKTDLPIPTGKIEAKKVSCVNDQNNFILRNINLEIEPGETVAVIGPSGSGKTSLARLLVGIETPDNGSILLDDVSIKNYDTESLGKHVGYLAQHVEFMEGTVKQNIARMSSEIDDAEVIKAAKDTFNHEVISGLDKGYDTVINLGAKNLSAGQKQRIALSRAFFGKPKLVVLDEPNSNLDAEGEKALENSLLKAKKAKTTVFVISHRTSILAAVDKILVMHKGQVKLFGPKKEILKKLNDNNGKK